MDMVVRQLLHKKGLSHQFLSGSFQFADHCRIEMARIAPFLRTSCKEFLECPTKLLAPGYKDIIDDPGGQTTLKRQQEPVGLLLQVFTHYFLLIGHPSGQYV